MKVAFVHDWLVTYRGGEKVLEALLEMYPEAPIYTLFYDSQKMPKSISQRKVIYPRFLAPWRKFRKALLPFLPAIIESFPLESYDLIISTSSCVAKGAIPGPRGRHICYLHSPMRYIWDQREHYLNPLQGFPGLRAVIHWLSSRLRLWDVTSSHRVDKFVVNSRFVGQRVKRYYNRDSHVIHPPIAVEKGLAPKSPALKPQKPYFLVVGAFVPYKRFDLAIKACHEAGKELVVAGSGPELPHLKKLGSKTRFVISPSDTELLNLYAHAEALIFPTLEDFGMTAVEAMSCGTPVIAYREGGALDFIKEGVTGCFFESQTVESLKNTLSSFRREDYNASQIQEFAQGFSKDVFLSKMRSEIEGLLKENNSAPQH